MSTHSLLSYRHLTDNRGCLTHSVAMQLKQIYKKGGGRLFQGLKKSPQGLQQQKSSYGIENFCFICTNLPPPPPTQKWNESSITRLNKIKYESVYMYVRITVSCTVPSCSTYYKADHQGDVYLVVGYSRELSL